LQANDNWQVTSGEHYPWTESSVFRTHSMERPASVTVIAILFLVVAAYLVPIGLVEFISPGTILLARTAGVTYGRELDSPQTAISVGLGWALVGWGLFRLRTWARWCAVVILVIGVAGSVPAVSAAARDITWRFFWLGTQIMVRIVIAWLLAASPEVVEAFVKK
jgi:hypothetical protein